MNWTTKQQEAIITRGNCIVSAAAGSGKTAVLTERICSLIIDEHTPVDGMLVLTFTKAAAAEMKKRIEKRLADAAAKAGTPAEKARLYEAAAGAAHAGISTIDSFCARVVRRYGHVLSLPSNIKILDDMGLEEWKQKAIHEVLMKGEADSDLVLLYNRFDSIDTVKEAIQKLSGFLDSIPDPEEWLKNSIAKYDDPTTRKAYMDRFTLAMREDLQRLIDAYAAYEDRFGEKDVKQRINMSQELACCKGLLLWEDYDSFRNALLVAEPFVKTFRFPNDFDPDEKKAIQDSRNNLKEWVKTKSKEYFPHDAAKEEEYLSDSADILKALANITLRYRSVLTGLKLNNGAMGFADIGHYAYKILQKEEIAAEYREKFAYIAVDEYQDTNELNDAVIRLVSRADNLFYVGDIKQSIYRFRRAEPALFKNELDTAEEKGGHRIDLQNNFRSSPVVLDAVNEVFRAIMRKDTNELDYDRASELVPGPEEKPGSATLYLLAASPEQEEETDTESLENSQAPEDASEEKTVALPKNEELEARLIAKKIRELIATQQLPGENGCSRKLQYSDIAILMRSKNHTLLFSSVLAEQGIPCYAQAADGYFDSTEITLLMNCLMLIDNSLQDIPMAAVMLSPIGRFTPDDLAFLRSRYPSIPFCDAVRKDAAENERIAAFLSMIDRWREDSRRITVRELISRILTETNFCHIMGSMQSGTIRRGNLDALMEQAADYESTGAKSLSGFLRYLTTIRKNVSVSSAQFASGNVVRIMTMHKSKGLEFPVVILPQLGRSLKAGHSEGHLVLHSKMGMGLNFINRERTCKVTTTAYSSIKAQCSQEDMAEEMRVLYVAMTRAKHHLLMVGTPSVKAMRTFNAFGSAKPDAGQIKGASCYLDWLACSPRTKIETVIVDPGELQIAKKPDTIDAPIEDPALTRRLEEALNWKYPHKPRLPLPQKTSVSRIKAGEVTELVTFREPGIKPGKRVSAAQIGTAAHALLQNLACVPMAKDDVREKIAELIREGILVQEAAEKIDTEKIAAFTSDSLWARMGNSKRLEKELPFHVRLEASRFFPEAEKEQIYLQGIIDCCFLEEDGWILVDYKTDTVLDGTTPEATAEKHRQQLALYAEALEKLTGKPVKEQLIVLLSLPDVIHLA